jgi:competence protein ComEC
MKNIWIVTLAIFSVIGAAFAFLSNHISAPQPTYESDSALTVHFIDVGQADCELVILPNGENMLIDAGNNSEGKKVVEYLKNLNITKIDYLIGTHPHADHIGGMDTVIENMDIGKIYMPKAETNTKTFEDVLDAIDAKNLTITTAKNGVNIYNDGETTIDIIAPNSDTYDSLNNYSAVILLKYRDASFLFSGDAEALSEGEIEGDISADVLKVGHHGSSTSSSQAFLNRVNPKYAVISCGEGNSYSHPHKETLDKLSAMNVTLYRTDLNGSIICETDGENYSWECEK